MTRSGNSPVVCPGPRSRYGSSQMKHPVWEQLSPATRIRVDELIQAERRLQAVKVLRDEASDPPGLYEGIEIIHDRYAELGVPWVRSTPRLDIDALAATVADLPERPDAIEALWDEDSFSAWVTLYAITLRPRTETYLGSVRHGTDRPAVDPATFPQGSEAATVGRALAERLEIPFHFPSPGRPDHDPTRWWDGR